MPTGGLRVLIVGDDADAARRHASLLRQQGLAVWVENDPQRIPDTLEAFLPELHQSRLAEQRLFYALEGSGQGIWDLDLQTRRAHFSAQWKDLLGYDDEDPGMDRTRLIGLVHPEDRARCLADYERHLAGETHIFENEHRARRKDGSYVWILSRGKVVVRDDDGRPLRIVGTDTDISARKCAEARRQQADEALQALNADLEARVGERTWKLVEFYNQLQEEEHFLRALFEISPVGLVLFRVADGQLLDCNQAFAQILDVPIEALVGRAYGDLVSPDSRPRRLDEFAVLQQTGAFRGHETHYLTRRGDRVPVRQSCRLVEKKGERLAWLVVEDISERCRRDAVTEHLTRQIATLTGQQLFNAVCDSLSQLLGAEQVFVGRVLQEQGSIRVLAWKSGDEWLPLRSFSCAGTIFESVVDAKELVRHDRLQDLFPDKTWPGEQGLGSFAGLPLTDFSGVVMGVLGVMGRAPFSLPQVELESMLQLFAIRVKAEMQRISAEQRFHELFQFSPDAIILADGEGRIRQVNEAAPRLFDYAAEDMAALLVEDLVPEPTRRQHVAVRRQYMELSAPRIMAAERQMAVRGQRRDGSVFPLEISLVPVDTDQGRWVAAVIRDISEREDAQRRIQASLREKETLLKEIHHRVKNNLQIISSLLSMQSDRLASEDARDALRESQHRVRSMALIHERLYRNEDLNGVDFGDYIQSLVSVLYRSYRHEGCRVNIGFDLDDVQLNVDTAIPCGLLINEMVTNAFKHAFVGREEGELRVTLVREDEWIRLTVADDGPGIPAGFDWQRSDSLGAMLIHTLSKQIKAELAVSGPPGTCYTLKFKELLYATR
ncbi:PAS domain S-box protein [Denitratisoma sp. DHT3]|uniref:PAS domain-containing sensor histidine kinase n=1 Tax=Denitratisoma sp. DHT3 TaxID=1981880 RepID=UPI001644ED7D|nr:PAS domain S-box protein [Denitratisoma sp. DHT3]